MDDGKVTTDRGDEDPAFVVGVILKQAKASKHLSPSLLQSASEHGIKIVPLTPEQFPLEQHGPFHALLHKIHHHAEWREQLDEYAARHGSMAVVDSFAAIEPIQNRSTMLASLQGSVLTLEQPESADNRQRCSDARVSAPMQVALEEGCSLEEAFDRLDKVGMHPPLLAKPMWADGREGCHGLALIHDTSGVERLVTGRAPGGICLPVVLQQFIEHGGNLFKVYVLGDIAKAVRRPSLQIPAELKDVTGEKSGIQTLTRISAYHSSTSSGAGQVLQPPPWVVTGIARHLRGSLHMNLFNFDVICPTSLTESGGFQYLVVDINYFPGYEKLPRYENLMVSFLSALRSGRLKDYDRPITLVQE